MEGFPKQSGAACNSKLGIRVFQLEQWQATLPVPDLVTDPLPQELGTERAPVEQDRIDARTTPQECGKVPSDRTIRCIGEPPLFQGGLRPSVGDDRSNGDFPTLKPFLPNSPLTRESFDRDFRCGRRQR